MSQVGHRYEIFRFKAYNTDFKIQNVNLSQLTMEEITMLWGNPRDLLFFGASGPSGNSSRKYFFRYDLAECMYRILDLYRFWLGLAVRHASTGIRVNKLIPILHASR